MIMHMLNKLINANVQTTMGIMYDVKTCLTIDHYLNVCNLCLRLR